MLKLGGFSEVVLKFHHLSRSRKLVHTMARCFYPVALWFPTKGGTSVARKSNISVSPLWGNINSRFCPLQVVTHSRNVLMRVILYLNASKAFANHIRSALQPQQQAMSITSTVDSIGIMPHTYMPPPIRVLCLPALRIVRTTSKHPNQEFILRGHWETGVHHVMTEQVMIRFFLELLSFASVPSSC